MARGAKSAAAYADLTALAASGRSPSELRRRVAHLFGEPLGEPVRLTRGGVLTVVALAALLVAPAAWPSRTDSADAAQASGSEEASNGESAEERAVPISIVVARHVMLLEGREIITWEELDKKIAALPNPSLAHPSFYVTRGAREAGLEDAAKAEIWKLHQKHQLQGHSEGSLWTQADFRYDGIENADDLKPDESLRIERTIVDKDGQPVAGAEVVLITPIDESIPYKTWHVTLVQGRLRNRLENVLDDSNAAGRVALYPPKDEPYYLIALHPDAGFALVGSNDAAFKDQREIKLLPWAGLISQLAEEPERNQEASVDTKVAARDGFPEIEFDQYWSEQKSELPAGFFGFTHVPPIFETSLSRSFPESDGGSVSVPGASVSLLPGEIRRLDLGPLTDQQRELLERVREQFRQRGERPAAAPAPPAEDVGDVAADATDVAAAEDAAEAFDGRFVACQVHTDLEQRLLGAHEAPVEEASICVFVNNRAFAEEPIDATSRPFLLLSAWLKEQAQVDDRLMVFRLQDEVDQDGKERHRQRGELLEKICRELAVKAGFQKVRASMTYGVEWVPSLARARAAAGSVLADDDPPRVVRSSLGNDRVRVYAVRTLLERLLIDADCFADVLPVLRGSDGADFPQAFVADIKELAPQLGDMGRQTLLLSVRHRQNFQRRLDEWVEDRAAREAFARELGFETCNVQSSPMADEDADSENTP